jgi:hypothetical protein
VRKSIKNITLGALSLGAFALVGCMSNSATGPQQDEYGTVVLQTKTNDVNRLSKPGLGKSALITLETLTITAISNATTPDTVITTLSVGDSGFTDVSTDDQTINITLNLKALRSWTISAKTTDANDSVIQSGSVSVTNLKAGEVQIKTLNATPNFTMYTANFNFPDSIFSPTGLFGQKVNLTKIELLVDGVVKDDSLTAFADSTDYELAYDYVGPDADSVTLKVYGNLTGATTPWNAGNNLLYSKTVAITSLNAVYPAANNVSLTWRGPTGGAVDLTVEIEKVGQVAIDGYTPPVVLD